MVDAGMEVLTTEERHAKYYERNPTYLHLLDIPKGRVWKSRANRYQNAHKTAKIMSRIKDGAYWSKGPGRPTQP
ncbi:hypothetical protein U9M48_024485 [Paspalum notatum var. saurae]|uniref:Uncharacterized protein n=1 Tax=Paspalum notatum var. saurae TaxID=547442 RepID=A0AAQ3WWN6_PASNO